MASQKLKTMPTLIPERIASHHRLYINTEKNIPTLSYKFNGSDVMMMVIQSIAACCDGGPKLAWKEVRTYFCCLMPTFVLLHMKERSMLIYRKDYGIPEKFG